MQSRALPEDGRARSRWHIRRRRDDGRTEGLTARFAISAIAAIAVLVLSCGDGAVEPPPPPPAPVPTTVAVSPGSATLTALGETARFTAEVRDQNGQVMAGAAVAWTTGDASVASVDASGQATSAGNGTATITATAGSVSGSATVTVEQLVSAVSVSPTADTLVALGDTVRLVAEATDANGHGVVAVTEFVWSSSDTLVARVDDSGLVKSLAEGMATVTAAASEVTGGAELTVVPPLPTTIALSRDTVTLTALGQTAQLEAEVREQAGRVMAEAFVAWSSSDTLVAVVDSAGLVTAVGGGTTTVTVAAGDVSDTVVVTVTQSAGSVVVSPSEGRVAIGDTLRLAAEAFDENGHAVEGAAFSWSSSDVGVAGVDETGLVTGVAEGTAKVTATSGDASGVAEITVESPDRAALVALYEATDGPNWVNNENWLTDAPLGDWYGVDTHASGRVFRIDLSGHWDDDNRRYVGHGLVGTIPPELGNLTRMSILDLGVNGLTGTIPPELGNLGNLTWLILTHNSLRGVIPPELGRLARLEVLNLDWNLLRGRIPPELGQLANLEVLWLGRNELTGPIPPELRGLTSLRELRFGWNSLSGVIPLWLGELTELSYLSLRNNDFTGPIPPELGDLTKLRRGLLLDENGLTGPIPPELGRLTNLGLLFLYDNDLTGPIPPELGDIRSLRVLSLWGNNLTGPIPPELGNLTALTGLSLSENNLTGRVPVELGKLTQLRDISLSGNKLKGSVPLSFVGLDNLETFGCRFSLGVCVPATDEFRAWVREVDVRGNFTSGGVDIPFCDEIDAQALGAVYEATNGSDWTQADGWLEDENLGRWHGVQTDSIGRVSGLDLTGNGLAGSLPDAVGLLVGMRELRVGNNELTGRLPLSLASVPLEEFDYGGTALCAPDDASFQEWLNGVPRHSGTGVQCPPLTDRDILESLYWTSDGPNWHNRTGWTTDAPLDRWHGVTTDAAGRVIELRLPYNGLSGPIPPELGGLGRLEQLDLAWNQLHGGIPSELGGLPELRILNLFRNRLSGPIAPELGDLVLLQQLSLGDNELTGEIPEELANLADLAKLDLRWNLLSGSIPAALGNLSRLVSLELDGNQLRGRIPSELGGLAGLESIRLADNQLTGPIPPQLGALRRLAALDLSGNRFTGSIPSALGGHPHLRELRLSSNEISGSIPSELGHSGDLWVLELADNQLSGSIPGELGRLGKLVTLNLGDNELAGPLPAELGQATRLNNLDLRSNALTGPVPSEFGNLAQLKQLILADNPGLAGPMPSEILAIGRLERLMAGGTVLCRPPDAAWAAWFRSIADRRLVRCEGGVDAYLTQSVQSWDDPVPLLAGEPALLRVFVTAAHAGTAAIPDVRATFFVAGAERHSVDIAGTTQPIPSEIMEGDLALSANAEIPDWVIVPGLEMVIEVDPEGTLDSAVGVTRRIPEEGRMAVDVQPVQPFRLTLIPFLNETEPDSSALADVFAMAADPDRHALLRDVRTLLPIGGLAVEARAPVMVSTPDIRSMLRQVAAMRLMEGGSGYWMGIWDGVLNAGLIPATRGIAYLGGEASATVRNARTIAHELGHNLSLNHAPCGSPSGVDPWFPHDGGRTGAWGYDIVRHRLVTPEAPDIMSYCTSGFWWISDYFFNKALVHRLATDGGARAARAAEADPVRSLLIWGGRDRDGVPYLDPAFVVDATPSMPSAGGEYTIEGATADGTAIFSFAFDMPVTGDAEGDETSFVFTLPVQAGWADNLASITLSGPGGSVTLDDSTDHPMAILRDPQTGQVRAFLSDLPSAAQAAADAVGQPARQGLEMLFSRGIPGVDAGRR